MSLKATKKREVKTRLPVSNTIQTETEISDEKWTNPTKNVWT